MADENTPVVWDIDTKAVIDTAFVSQRSDELVGAKRLQVSSARFVDEDTLAQVLVPSLEKVEFSFFEVGATAGRLHPKPRAETNAALDLLSSLPMLRSLDLAWSYAIDDSGVSALSALGQLEDLALESDITDQGLARLRSLTELRTLDLTCSSKFNGSGFENWPEMSHLRALVLSQCTGVSDEALCIVEKTPRLDFLVLSGCKQLTTEGLRALKVGESLESLFLYGLELDVLTLRKLRENNPVAELEVDMSQFSGSELVAAEALTSPD